MLQKRSTNAAGAAPGSLRGLLALNAALLGVLAMVSLGSGADAQQARSRGQYTAVAGGVNGANGEVVYIADVVNQEILAITYNRDDQRLEGIAWRSLRQDTGAGPGGVVKPGGGGYERNQPR